LLSRQETYRGEIVDVGDPQVDQLGQLAGDDLDSSEYGSNWGETGAGLSTWISRDENRCFIFSGFQTECV
jgi:hypothetical protein